MKKLTFKSPEFQSAYDAAISEVSGDHISLMAIEKRVDEICKFCEFTVENFKPDTAAFAIAGAVATLVFFRMARVMEISQEVDE